MNQRLERIAFISVHACPTVRLGLRDSGGMNVYIHNMVRELAKQGIAVDVFTRRHDESDPESVEMFPGARLIHINDGSTDTPKELLPSRLSHFQKNLQRYVSEHQLSYDIVHSHYWLSGLVGAKLARTWSVPHVATFHTLAITKVRARVGQQDHTNRDISERKIATNADLLVVSTSDEQDLLAHHFDVQLDRICVISCGVDTDLFRPLDQTLSRSLLGLGHMPIALFVGRPDPVKGAELLLQAVAKMEVPQDAQLVVVGGEASSEPEAANLHALARKLGLAARIQFAGTVPHNLLPFYYNAADVLVMPSYAESFGLAALEAMACGTPVVAARVGGLVSLLKDGLSGYLVPWHCPEPFARRIEILLSHPHLRNSMGRLAMLQARKHNWLSGAKSLATAYNLLLSKRNGVIGGYRAQ
jgi:D-inositol-3-phosphate glycosyltransferase